uniref:Uncharacterized protein n=1 Tax=Periophthalmus magnuspinnatus TaxID=409849 RepID=A0A3B4B3W0_9GOBI
YGCFKMLKKDLCEMGKRVEELKDQKKEEQDYTKSAVHLTKSVEATRAHLQGQLRSKEAENNRLTVQLRVQNNTTHCKNGKSRCVKIAYLHNYLLAHHGVRQ